MALSATATVEASGSFVDAADLVENAIHAWIVAGSGLDADHVIWSAEATGGGPMPSGTYVEMRLLATDTVSEDWVISRNESETIVNHVRGTRHPTLELTCFAGGRYGANRAQSILTRVLAALRLPRVAALLRSSEVGIGDRGKVRVLEGRRSTMFDPRAVVEVELHTCIDITDIGSAIERVEMELVDGSQLNVSKHNSWSDGFSKGFGG